VLQAFAWGFVAAASLLVGAVVALKVKLSRRLIGLIMAFGVGALISAVAYDLVLEAMRTSAGSGGVGPGLFAGALAFFVGDLLIDRLGGEKRKASQGAHAGKSALPIVLGIVLDGIPESIVLGLTLLSGSAGVSLLAAVFISNVPESIAASTGLYASGWSRRRILGLWTLVALISGLAAMVGFVTLDNSSPSTIAFIEAFAGGAILTMLADTMAPEAFEYSGRLTGLVTTLGYAVAFALTVLE
jgi:ZIP family zinc transporter